MYLSMLTDLLACIWKEKCELTFMGSKEGNISSICITYHSAPWPTVYLVKEEKNEYVL